VKRDMNLIRLLLLEQETGDKVAGMAAYTEEQILYHCELAIEADLLVGEAIHNGEGRIASAIIQRLSWTGHDFLDAARDENNWKMATERIAKAGGSWTFDLLKQLLIEIVKASLFPKS